MVNKASKKHYKKLSLAPVLMVVLLAVSTLGASSDQVNAVFQPGQGDAPATPAEGEKGETQATPTPSASASASPATSAQPESDGTDNTSTDAASEASKNSSPDWTPWLVGGGVMLLTAAAGSAWYIKKRK